MTSKHEAGNILLLTALSLVFLMGFLGLAIDMGMMRYEKRLQQTAADAAAIAGATDLAFGSGVSTSAQAAATANGFTDTSGGTLSTCTASGAAVGTVCVQVNNPPSYLGSADPHNGDSNYVEVLVGAVHPTYFMGFVKINSATVVARAEATDLSGNTTTDSCLYTLGPPTAAIVGVNVQGSAYLNAPTCGIADDGNFDPTGGTSQLIIKAGTFNASGQDTGHGGNVTCSSGQNPCPQYGAPTQPDPESSLTAPSQPAASTSCALDASGRCNVVPPSGTVLQPGKYSSIIIGSNVTNVTMASGVYYINCANCSTARQVGLYFDGGGQLLTASGNGVMMYFTCATNVSGCSGATVGAKGGGNNPDINLTAMTDAQSTTYAGSAEYANVLMYENPNDVSAPTLGGDDSSAFNGILYFPTQTLSFYGNGHSTKGFTAGIVIAYSLKMTGNPMVNIVGLPDLPSPQPSLTNAILVE